jgi:hypothetical protein
MSTLQGLSIQITTQGNNEKPIIISLSNTKVSVLWNDISGAYKAAKIAEVDVTTGAVLCTANIGLSNKHVIAGSLLKYDTNKYIVSWTQDNGDYEGYIRAYSNCNHLEDSEKLDSTNYYDVAKISLARLQGDKFIAAWNTFRYHGDHNHYRIHGEIYELESNNEIDKHMTLSFSSDSHDIHDQSIVASFASGRSIAVWREKRGNNEIRAKLFESNGNSVSSDWEVNQGTDHYIHPDVKTIGDKAFVVWYKETGSNKGIYGRLINALNVPVSNEFLISKVPSGIVKPKITVADNKFLVHWNDAPSGKVFVKVFNSEGSFINTECKVLDANVDADNYSTDALSNTDIVYSWSQDSQIYIGTKKVSKICDITDTKSHTVTVSASDTKTAHTQSVSKTETISMSSTHTQSDSESKSNSASVSDTASQSDTQSMSSSNTESLSTSGTNSNSLSSSDTNSQSMSDTQSMSLSASDSLTNSASSSASYSITESPSATATDSSTVSESISTSGTNSNSLSSSDTNSQSMSDTQSMSLSASDSLTNSASSSASYSITESPSATATDSSTVSESISNTDTNSASISSTVSRYKPGTQSPSASDSSSESVSGTITLTQSGSSSVTSSSSTSFTDSISQTSSASVSSSESPTASDSQTKSITNSNTQSESSSSSQSMSESNTNSLSLTNSLEVSGTKTITLKCGKDVRGIFKDKILLDVRVDNIKVTNVDTSNPQLYTQHTSQKHSNSGRSNTNEQIKLSIKDNSKDYIDNFQERVINTDYIINGTVNYSNNVLNTELVHSNPDIIQTERVNCQRDDYTSYDLLHTNLRYHGINKCEYNVINDQKDIILRPNECSITSMTATFNKNVKVSYDADLIISARNKFNGKAADDELKVIGECLLLPNISWQFVNDGKQIKAHISGTITHTALQSINLDRTDCVLALPYVSANLVYKDFHVTAPTNLDQFIVSYSNSKDYVNTNRYGDININAHLALNIPLTGETEGFNRDIASTEFIKSGRVIYLNEKIIDSVASHNGDISGYQVRDSKLLEYDIFALPNKIPTHSFISWDSLNVKDNINFSVVPNGCKKAVIEAFVYKDVPLSYTAKGYLGLKDENGRVIAGSSLEASSSQILNKQFSIERQEAVFGISGTMTHSLIKSFAVYTEDCASIHQSTTALPEVIVSLTYSDYVFTPPSSSDFDQNLKRYTSGQSLINNKKYGTTQATSSPKLEVKLSKSLNSHYDDIKQNDIVKDGTVQYIRNFNDIQNLHNNDHSGYKLDTMGDVVTQSWFSSRYKVSSQMSSAWNKLTAEATFTESIVPGQCIDIKLVASIYEGVRVGYNAKGYFTAKTLDGRSIQGEELLNVAQMVIDKEDITLNSNGEAVFSTGGFLEHSFVAGVASNSSDCGL